MKSLPNGNDGNRPAARAGPSAVAIRSDTTLNAAARRTQLGTLADEATARISTALGGSRGLDAYKEYGGQWLTNLVPRPPTPPQPPKN